MGSPGESSPQGGLPRHGFTFVLEASGRWEHRFQVPGFERSQEIASTVERQKVRPGSLGLDSVLALPDLLVTSLGLSLVHVRDELSGLF